MFDDRWRQIFSGDTIDDIEALLNIVDGKVDAIDTNVDDIETLLNTVDGKVDALAIVVAASKVILDNLLLDSAHENFLFPEDTNETVTFVAGNVANTFGAWVEIVDNNAVTFSSKLAACNGHISSIVARGTSVKDKEYIFEISYGDAKIVVARANLLSGTNQLSTVQQNKMRNLGIPAGETVYYRMKCETASATMGVRMRYHCHD